MSNDIPEPAESSPEPSESSESSTVPTSDFSLGLSRKQIAVLLGIVVVASLLIWRLRSDDDGDGAGGRPNAKKQIERARTDDLGGEVHVEDDEQNDVIDVPVQPGDELEKDAAVLEALKRNGRMKGAGS